MATSTSSASIATSSSASSSTKRLGGPSPSNSVICEEVFDETCQPSAEEINDYATLLGIDPVKEPHLLHLAKEGLMQALPADWKICYSEEKSGHYYFNTKTKKSQWDHPLDAVYRDLVEQARLKPASAQVTSVNTPIIDTSDDASQLDSGIRSLQVTEECDNTTTNTNEISSPIAANCTMKSQNGAAAGTAAANIIAANPGLNAMAVNSAGNSSSTTTTATTTSGFSGGVSRFLESRSKNFGPIFTSIKNTRFEVSKPNSQVAMTAMKFGGGAGKVDLQEGGNEKKGFTLSGTGAMFLKSRKQIEANLSQASSYLTDPNVVAGQQRASLQADHVIFEASGTPPGVKGILRDSSLTDMRRRLDRDDSSGGGNGGSGGSGGGLSSGSSNKAYQFPLASEDKKSVRFNLDELKIRGSPEEEPSSSRKFTQSPEVSVNSDDEQQDDDDLWDDEEEQQGHDLQKRYAGCDFDNVNGDEEEEDDDDDEEMQGACGGYPRKINLNPFLMNDEYTRENGGPIKVIPVAKAQTIQMMKAQSFSMDLPSHQERFKLSDVNRAQSCDIANAELPLEAGAGGGAAAVAPALSYLDKLKENNAVKPLYEDTDSESKASSVRSFIINKSEQESMASTGPTNPFDLDELDRKHKHEVEQLEMKLQSTSNNNNSHNKVKNHSNKLNSSSSATTNAAGIQKSDSGSIRNFKIASKLVGFLKKDSSENLPLSQDQAKDNTLTLKEERDILEQQLQDEIDKIKFEHEQKLKSIRHEYDLRLTSHQHELEEAMELQLEEYRLQLDEEMDSKRKQVVDDHKAHMATMQQNHAEIIEELERDLKSEEEILKKEHAQKLNEMRDKLSHELEMERQRMREAGEDRLYEKVRCEKRLLEDKYRCLKEKYIRLKTDVKLSLERRNRRREAQALNQQSLQTNTGSVTETDRSISNKPSIGNSENKSLSFSASCQDQPANPLNNGTLTSATGASNKTLKPPVPPKTHLQSLAHSKERERERKPGIASKYLQKLQIQDDTTSISQSDTTISNNYTKGRYLPIPTVVSDNGNSDSEALNDEGQNQENSLNNNNHNGSSRNTTPRKKLFSRTKSASTSRLNNDLYKNERPCTPVEVLRSQLQKLDDLEDQFPENTLDATYHLRYPFTDISNDHPAQSSGALAGANAGPSNAGNNGAATNSGLAVAASTSATTHSELEFFKHRIHLERDSVRRAKESLRNQRNNFRARQREIKQHHQTSMTRQSLEQLIHEEKELTEMEVNLHRTRALLGEKVIRLRHLEQSLLRVCEKEKPSMDLLGLEPKDDATLSDLSSHSSSGFSSTDFASAADTHNKRKEFYHQESSECIQNLEILNAEIREILDLLGQKQQQHHHHQQQMQQQNLQAANGLNASLMSATNDYNWPHSLMGNGGLNGSSNGGAGSLSASSSTTTLTGACSQNSTPSSVHYNQPHHLLPAASSGTVMHAPQSIPTLADRLENYRQMAAGRMQTSLLAANTIVSQNPRALNYTTSLVERTRDLRNWLRQAKNEHELLASMTLSQISPGPGIVSNPLSVNLHGNSGGGGGNGSNNCHQTNL